MFLERFAEHCADETLDTFLQRKLELFEKYIPIFLRLDRIVIFACVSRALSLFYYGMRLGEFLIRRNCSNTFLNRDLQVTNQNANALRRGPLLLKDDRYVQYFSTSGI